MPPILNRWEGTTLITCWADLCRALGSVAVVRAADMARSDCEVHTKYLIFLYFDMIRECRPGDLLTWRVSRFLSVGVIVWCTRDVRGEHA